MFIQNAKVTETNLHFTYDEVFSDDTISRGYQTLHLDGGETCRVPVYIIRGVTYAIFKGVMLRLYTTPINTHRKSIKNLRRYARCLSKMMS